VDLPEHAAVGVPRRLGRGSRAVSHFARLALAILAWLQTLPEFAVEAVIAWEAGRNPERAHLAIANLTGAIRLLLGLGWPMIYFVFAAASRRRGAATRLPRITLEPEHAIEVMVSSRRYCTSRWCCGASASAGSTRRCSSRCTSPISGS